MGRTVEEERVRVEHELVARVADEAGNLASGFHLSEFEESVVGACVRALVFCFERAAGRTRARERERERGNGN